ncbi:MAG: hypothetical protein EOO88_20185, partial [Pedobacter sp.]
MKQTNLNGILKCHRTILMATIFAATLVSCKKSWLDAKPNFALVVPKTPEAYQALLNNTSLMNINAPGLGVVSDDNLSLSVTTFRALSVQERSAYTWADTEVFFGGNVSSDWSNAYNKILQTNIVIDGLNTIGSRDSEQYRTVMGSALFFRGLNHFHLAQLFCPAFSISGQNEQGLPLHLSANVNLDVAQSTVGDTYNQVLRDIRTSVRLLPTSVQFPSAPSKAAAYALLSRIYLAMEDYDQAFLYADSCLKLKSTLLDYSKLSSTATNPFTRFNEEVIFHENIGNYAAFRTSNLIVAPMLYGMYANGDLRRSLYFLPVNGNISFKGSYDGSLL